MTRTLITAVCAAAIGTFPALASAEAITTGMVIDGVTIVDTRDGKLTPNRELVLAGGKIVRIVAAGSVKAAGNALAVDGRGKFAVPGYLDMHAHPLGASDSPDAYALMIANGITGFRQMSGSPELLAARARGEFAPSGSTPELLAMPGTILTSANAGTPAIAVAEVDKQKAQGADFIKTIDVAKPDAFFASLAEATRLGLSYGGHLPATIDVTAAAKAGMRNIEHLGPRDSVMMGCSTNEAEARTIIANTPPPPTSLTPGPGLAAFIERATANPIAFTPPAEFVRYQKVVDGYSEAKCKTLAAAFVAGNTWQAPTLIRVRTMMFGDDPVYRNDPNMKYIVPVKLAMWKSLGVEFPTRVSPAAKATLTQTFATQLKMVKVFEDNGVGLLAGTDSGGSGNWLVPGFSLHQEFDLLAQAGLSPLHVLQATTLNGAVFLGRTATLGTVAVGKNADLVLLDANPIESVQNLHKIAGVVRLGTYYSPEKLDALKKRVADRIAALPPAPPAPPVAAPGAPGPGAPAPK